MPIISSCPIIKHAPLKITSKNAHTIKRKLSFENGRNPICN